jgi:hypothetical protein
LFKKIFILCMTLMFLLCIFGLASVAGQEMDHESVISLRWTLIHRVSNGLSIDSNGQASMTSFISAYSGVERVRITAHLQRQENDTWVTVKNWSQDYEGTSALWTKTWYVNKGYNYRLMTFFYAYAGDDQESTFLISGSQYY